MFTVELLVKNDYYHNFLQLLEQLTIVNSHQITYEEFSDHYDNLKSEVYVIKDPDANNIVIATGSIFIEPKFIRKLSNVAHIEDIVVDSNYRKKGLGKIIINHLKNIAKIRGCYKVILNCDKHNVGFYESCGFTKKECEMALYF
jgi:glucosamine-phosphate N-acetyltransferase